MTSSCKDVVKLLNHAGSTNQRVTAPKVLDAWYGKGTPSLRVKDVKVPGVAREKAERILAHMLLEGFIKEDFHFTAYSTICYLVPGTTAFFFFTLVTYPNRITLEVYKQLIITNLNQLYLEPLYCVSCT